MMDTFFVIMVAWLALGFAALNVIKKKTENQPPMVIMRAMGWLLLAYILGEIVLIKVFGP